MDADFEAMLSELEKVKSDLNAALASKNAAIASKDAAIATAGEDLASNDAVIASKDAAIAKTAAKHTYTTKDEEDKEFFRLLPDLQYNSTVQPSVKKIFNTIQPLNLRLRKVKAK